jgi:histone deacetylase 1/2
LVSKRTVPPTKTNIINEPVRKSRRVIKPRECLIKTCITTTTPKVTSSIQTPLSLKEALTSPKANLWLKAILEEHNTLKWTLTYKLVDLPIRHKALRAKPIFKLKVKANRSPKQFKAHIVIQGYTQKEGIDFFKTYTPVLHYKTLQFLLTLAILLNLDIHQMDINLAFLQANLKEEVYMQQPEGLINPNHPHKVWHLLKSLYGLKQAPMVWNKTINSHLKSSGFKSMDTNPCIYIKWSGTHVAIITLYVNNLIVITHPNLLKETKAILSSRFLVKDLQEPTLILSMEVIWNHTQGTLELHQSGHIVLTLVQAGMANCKPITTPMEFNLQLKTLSSTPAKCQDLPY